MRNKWSFPRRVLSSYWAVFRGGVLALLMAGGLAGCSGGDTFGRQKVKGSVTLDGQPLESGSIRFEPRNASGIQISAGAVVKDGQFVIAADQGLPKGAYKVSISSPDGGSRPPSMPDPKAPPPRERIPEKYNTKTTLAVELAPEQDKGLTFELTSK